MNTDVLEARIDSADSVAEWTDLSRTISALASQGHPGAHRLRRKLERACAGIVHNAVVLSAAKNAGVDLGTFVEDHLQLRAFDPDNEIDRQLAFREWMFECAHKLMEEGSAFSEFFQRKQGDDPDPAGEFRIHHLHDDPAMGPVLAEAETLRERLRSAGRRLEEAATLEGGSEFEELRGDLLNALESDADSDEFSARFDASGLDLTPDEVAALVAVADFASIRRTAQAWVRVAAVAELTQDIEDNLGPAGMRESIYNGGEGMDEVVGRPRPRLT